MLRVKICNSCRNAFIRSPIYIVLLPFFCIFILFIYLFCFFFREYFPPHDIPLNPSTLVSLCRVFACVLFLSFVFAVQQTISIAVPFFFCHLFTGHFFFLLLCMCKVVRCTCVEWLVCRDFDPIVFVNC